jgi:hypothetical protein
MALAGTNKKAIVRPLARNWVRGPAKLEGDAVVVDFSRGSSYSPLGELRVGLELMTVKTPEGARAFAERYGLLVISQDDRKQPSGRERVGAFLETSEDLNNIVKTMSLVRRASRGDADAVAILRARFITPIDAPIHDETWPPEWKAYWTQRTLDERRERNAWDTRSLLIHASDFAAWGLNDGLMSGAQGSTPYVFDRAQQGEEVGPGQLRIGVLAESLKQVCYLTVAIMLSHESVAACQNCGNVFEISDPRQTKYCRPTCGNRYRVRKHAKLNPRKKNSGGKRGEASRKR